MLWHSSKSATPLQCAVTKNAAVNPLECVVAKSLDLKSLRMNSYKKGWGYSLVEAPVMPSKTKTLGFRSRAHVSCVVVAFSERLAGNRSPRLRSGLAPVLRAVSFSWIFDRREIPRGVYPAPGGARNHNQKHFFST